MITAILGLGLMGGSFARALREADRARTIIGYDPSDQAARLALELGVIDDVAGDVAAACQEAGLIILAAPVTAIPPLLERAGEHAPQGALLLDLGSTKGSIVEAMDALPARVRAVGGHPMCGRETGGIEHSDAGLFEGAAFVLCETARTDDEAKARAEKLVTAVGARPIWLGAADHDRRVAAISHLPYLLACALVRAAERAHPDAWPLAAGGFRDSSRVAASDPGMMGDAVRDNAAEVVRAARLAREQLDALIDALETENGRALHELLEGAARVRRTL